MDAIETRYLGATNYRPGRIKATTLGNFAASYTMGYDHAASSLANHKAAAALLLEKLGWSGVAFVPGSTKTGYVWAPDLGDHIRVRQVAA